MSLFDKLSKTVVCPECRRKGAKKFLFLIKCREARCKFFDTRFRFSDDDSLQKTAVKKHYSGNFLAGKNALSIKYRNFLGEDIEFTGDKTTLRLKGHFVSVKVEPTGERISLKKKYIKNLSEVLRVV